MKIRRTKKSIDELCLAIEHGYEPTEEDLELFDFCNDVLGKFLLKNHHEMTKIIIEEVLHISGNQLRHAATHQEPNHITQKEMINDVCFFNENEEMIIFEIQKEQNTKNLRSRLQAYGYFHITEQLKIKDDYSLKPIHLCVLLDDGKDFPTLIENGDYLFEGDASNSLLHCKIVHLEVINRIVKEKGIENLTISESIFYVLNNSIDDDILKLERQVIQKMSELRDYWLSTTFAEHRAAFHQMYNDWIKRCEETQRKQFKLEKETFIQEKKEFESEQQTFAVEQKILEQNQLVLEQSQAVFEKEQEEFEKEQEEFEKEQEAFEKEREVLKTKETLFNNKVHTLQQALLNNPILSSEEITSLLNQLLYS